jgi:hypothetical protein
LSQAAGAIQSGFPLIFSGSGIEKMSELIKPIILYQKNFGIFDYAIVIVGLLVCIRQLIIYSQLKNGIQARQGPKYDQSRNQLVSTMRLATLAIDGLPLLGLLGTVGALLVTFAGTGSGGKLANNVIADFAPGLTSTISGIIFAMVNLVIFQILLQPLASHFKGDQN